ncbi:unnamed protein product [Mytilus coruscus]|uniref:B box-type domain-containing protein n=1 Tax=Mytilus coruscus TaxID=42192 RepID=A0A6J8BDC1_MYTCO|nr:unnamed protein product [Mytilus coruscus]
MASNPKFCSICDQRHITKPSISWCYECNQALCTECTDFHALIKASQNHSTITISNYQALDSSFSQVEGHCSMHNDLYLLFCQTHDRFLCLTCFDEHTKCEDIVRIKNLSDLKKQRDSILREIIQIREKINSHLNQIENTLKTELDKLVDDQCNTNIGKTLEEIQNEKTKMEKFQQQMEDLYKYGSDLQTFFGLREISSKSKTTDHYLQTLGDNGRLDKLTISCTIDRKISEFIKEVNSLGSSRVQKIPSKIVIERSKDKQAQLVGVKKSCINDIKLKLEQTFKLANYVTGCCFLPDGKLVLCDRSRNNYVQILNQYGELMFEISMSPNFAFDVTSIDDKNVAVSSDSSYHKQINIINIDTKQIRSIPTGDKCHGITHNDGSLIVCVEGKGIQNVNTQSGKSTTIVPCDLKSLSRIVSSDNKLYYTNSKDHSVTCCDMGGHIIWIFRDENVVRDPRGIAVDNTGNVYTVSQHTLIVLSADGQLSRQLLSKEDGLKETHTIAYDKIKNRLCVVNIQNNGFLFDVTF